MREISGEMESVEMEMFVKDDNHFPLL
jgi:hypothetical protein